MKRRELNDVEELIFKTIEEHPGCNQTEVYEHLITRYRSPEYIRRGILRLIAIGLLINKGTNRAAALYCTPVLAQ